jgi:Spy/CpxP family protein refolding chaperone
VKKEIGMRPDQASRIDRIYASRVKEIDPVVKEYESESASLDKMVTDRLVDEPTLDHEISRYYSLRAEVGRSRLLMDYRIAKVLDVDQYAKLKAIADRRLKEAEGRRGRGGGQSAAPHGGLLR